MRKIFLLLAVCVCFFVTVPVFCFADVTADQTVDQTADQIGDQTADQTVDQTADQIGDQTADQTAEVVPESKYDQVSGLIIKYVFGDQPLTDSQSIAVDILSLTACILIFAVPFIVAYRVIRIFTL